MKPINISDRIKGVILPASLYELVKNIQDDRAEYELLFPLFPINRLHSNVNYSLKVLHGFQ